MKFNKKNIINIVLTLVVAFIYFYIFLPPLNIHALQFWVFLIIIYLFYLIISLFTFVGYASLKGNLSSIKLSKTFKIMFAIIPIVIAIILLTNFIQSPVFSSKSYAHRIVITEGKKFEDEVKPVDFNKVPLLD